MYITIRLRILCRRSTTVRNFFCHLRVELSSTVLYWQAGQCKRGQEERRGRQEKTRTDRTGQTVPLYFPIGRDVGS